MVSNNYLILFLLLPLLFSSTLSNPIRQSKQKDWLPISVQEQDNFIIAKSRDLAIYFQRPLNNQGNPFKVEIHNTTSKSIMFESNPILTPLQLSNYLSKDFAQYIFQGYLMELGVTLDSLTIKNITSYRLEDETKTFKLYLSTYVSQGFVTEFLFKVRVSRQQLRFSFKVLSSASSINRILWGWNAISESEGLYGFGERYLPEQNKRGQKFYTWCQDGGFGFGTEMRLPKGKMSTYMPMPFFLSSATGWGYFFDTGYRTDFDLDTQKDGVFRFNVQAPDFDMIFYTGNTPAESLGFYTKDLGRSLIPPLYMFGPWNMLYNEFGNLSHDNHYDNAIEAWEKFVSLDIPSSIGVDETRFFPIGEQNEQPEKVREMNRILSERGLYTASYINPNLDITYRSKYNEAAENDYLIKQLDGSIYTYFFSGAKFQKFRASMIDFSNPEAVKWWGQQLQEMIDYGYNGWMYDYAEYIDPDNVFRNGMTGRGYHNSYTNDYHKAAYDYLTALEPERVKEGYAPNYFYYVRSGYSGTHSNTWAQWTGDPSSNFSQHSGMPSQLSAMLSAGLSGLPFIGSDISGFVWTFSAPSMELWIRWTQLGTFSGTMHTQTHGTPILGLNKTHIHDWDDGTYAWRLNAKFRTQMLPYTYDSAHQARDNGLPLMRHLLLTFPQDNEAINQDYEYMFGNKMLIAPMTKESAHGREIYLPKGEDWYLMKDVINYDPEQDGRFILKFKGKLHQGGTTTHVKNEFSDLAPGAIKAGCVIPMYDATVDTVRHSKVDEIISLDQRDHLLYLWVFGDKNSEVAESVNDGVKFEMKHHKHNKKIKIKFNDTKDNRIIILEILLPDIAKLGQLKGLNKGKEIEQLSKFWDTSKEFPEKGKLVYHFEEETQILWVRFGGRVKQQGDQQFKFNILFD